MTPPYRVCSVWHPYDVIVCISNISDTSTDKIKVVWNRWHPTAFLKISSENTDGNNHSEEALKSVLKVATFGLDARS